MTPAEAEITAAEAADAETTAAEAGGIRNSLWDDVRRKLGEIAGKERGENWDFDGG